jgi:AcrR family transcriptional regulator
MTPVIFETESVWIQMEADMAQSLSRRERRKLETRQALLEAALALFRQKGYDNTTIEEITDAADVAKGTFFNYFPSKAALLGELAVWRVEQLRSALDVRQGAPASPMARIKLLAHLMHDQISQDIHLIQRAMATRLSAPPPPAHRGKHRLHGLFIDLVSEAQAHKEIRTDVEAELIADLLHIALFRRMVACRFGDERPPAAEHVDHVIDLLMGGLAGPNWRHT